MQRLLSGHPTVEFQARPYYAKCEPIIRSARTENQSNN